MRAFKVINLHEARFECTFGRGCEGACCRNGRPPVYAREARRIEAILHRVLPMLRPAARAAVAEGGFLSRRRKSDQPMARVVQGWCVFFNAGCVLHRLGAAQGEAFRYKPWFCAVFPLSPHGHGDWVVRQRGYAGEIWDLPCLDPQSSTVPAAQSLGDELALAQAGAQE